MYILRNELRKVVDKKYNIWYNYPVLKKRCNMSSIIITLYLIFAVIYDQLFKKLTKTMKNDGGMIVLLNLLGGLTCLFLIPLFDIKLPKNKYVYIFLTLACIFYALNDRFDITARRGIEASTNSMIKQLSTVFMTLIGLFILKEKLIIKKIIGAFLILISNTLVFYNKENLKKNKYVKYGVLASIFTTIALLIDVNYSEQFNLPIYVAITLIIPSILIIIFERINIKTIKKEFNKSNLLLILLTGISCSFMLILKLLSFRQGEIAIIAPLCSLTVILNVIVGYIFQKEKNNLLKKLISAVLIIIGIILIKI